MEQIDRRRILLSLSHVVPGLVMAIGAFLLALPFFVRLVPGAVGMHPITAVLFMAAGLAFECLRPRQSTEKLCRAMGWILASLIMIAALLRLLDCL